MNTFLILRHFYGLCHHNNKIILVFMWIHLKKNDQVYKFLLRIMQFSPIGAVIF